MSYISISSFSLVIELYMFRDYEKMLFFVSPTITFTTVAFKIIAATDNEYFDDAQGSNRTAAE